MGKSCKVVVCGQGSVGKSAVLEQLLYANHVAGSETMETLEDSYIGSVETDRGTREQVRLYDTRGLRDGHEFPRHYFTFADGFVLVYSIDSKESFKRVEALKKDIDRCRDKKEVCVCAIEHSKQALIEPFVHLASKMTQPQSKSTFPLSRNKNKGSGSLDS
uniref:NF-kappa-B inhibitor-interacting Ras-like protein 2 n=1 Tax=Sinocyclocheilus anshuiensis TaxID=1608454 RepID=A0A671QUV5_9TELE